DGERDGPAEVCPATIARDARDEIAVVVEQQNRQSIDLENLEDPLPDLLEQRRDVGGARERLRGLEEERELLPNTLLVRQDDRGLVHHELRPARPRRLGERLSRIGYRPLPDNGRGVPRALAVGPVVGRRALTDVGRQRAGS